MEKMIKEREQDAKLNMVPLEVVPLTSIHTATTSTTNTADGAKQLKQAVENLSIQIEEIKKLKNQFKLL